MFRFSIVTLYFLLLGTCQSNAESMAVALEAPISLRAKGYTISTQPHASAIDEKWAQYFYDHLKNRVPIASGCSWGVHRRIISP